MKFNNHFEPLLLAATLMFASTGPAWSANIITVNPFAAGLGTAGNAFTADALILGVNATLTIDLAGNAIESGIFYVTNATLAGGPVLTPGLNGTSGAASSYGLYGTFSATGTGSFGSTSLATFTYSLFGDPGHDTTFTAGGAISGGAIGDTQLAHGQLIPPGLMTIVPGAPFNVSMHAVSSLEVDASGGFFEPPEPFKIDISYDAFGGQVSSSGDCPPVTARECTLTITSATGVVDFEVSEPETLALLGFGLVGLGASYRRRKARPGI